MNLRGIGETNKSSDLFLSGTFLLITEQFLDAYKILSAISKQDRSAPVLFNLALCYIKLSDYTQAVQYLEEVLGKISSGKSLDLSMPDSNISKFLNLEKKSDAYLSPMIYDISALDMKLVSEKILRVLIDCYCRLNIWKKVVELGTRMQSKGYENVAKALIEAKNKTGD